MQKSTQEISMITEEKGMTHPTQGINARNTILCRTKKQRQSYRAWFMTLNNYTKEDIDTLTQPRTNLLKYIFQEELGKNGTPHLQGSFYFKNAIGLKTLKELNSKAHWEKAKNWEACINYCSKKESRNGKIYRKGIKEKRDKEKEKEEKEIEDELMWKKLIEMRKKYLIQLIMEEKFCMEIGHRRCCRCMEEVKPPNGGTGATRSALRGGETHP